MLPQGLTQIILAYLNVNTLVRLPLTIPLVRREIRKRTPMAIILALYPRFLPRDNKLIYDGWTLELVQQHRSKIGTTFQLFHLCRNPDIDVDIIRAYASDIDWYQLSRNFRWTSSTLFEFQDRIIWSALEFSHHLRLEMLDKHLGRICWANFSGHYHYFTCELLEQYNDCIDWHGLSYNEHLTIDIIDRYHDKLYWNVISERFTSPSLLLDRHRERIHWREFSRNKHLTMKDLERCGLDICWLTIAVNVTDPQILLTYCPRIIPYEYFRWRELSTTLSLTDALLEKFQNYLRWDLVSCNPSLTPTMILSWSEKLRWSNLSGKSCLTMDLLEKFVRRIDFLELSCNLHFILGPVVNDRERALNFIRIHREKWNWCELSYLFLQHQWEVILDYPEWPWVWK